MEFGTKQTLKAASSLVGGGHNVIQQTRMTPEVTGLDVGHVVVVTDGSIVGRWDGGELTANSTLGIVTTKQFDGDQSASVLRAGNYLRERVQLADGALLSVSQEFALSLRQLYVEGAWS